MEKLKGISDEERNNAGLGPLGPAPDIGKIDGPSGYPLAAMTNAGASLQQTLAAVFLSGMSAGREAR